MSNYQINDIITIVDDIKFQFSGEDNFTIKRKETARNKYAKIISYTKELLKQNKQVLLLLVHSELIYYIKDSLIEYKPLIHNGDQSYEDRLNIWNDFNSYKSNLMIASYASIKAMNGLDNKCQNIILGELANPKDHDRALLNLHKIAIFQEVNNHYLIHSKGTDPNMAKKIFGYDLLKQMKKENFLKACA